MYTHHSNHYHPPKLLTVIISTDSTTIVIIYQPALTIILHPPLLPTIGHGPRIRYSSPRAWTTSLSSPKRASKMDNSSGSLVELTTQAPPEHLEKTTKAYSNNLEQVSFRDFLSFTEKKEGDRRSFLCEELLSEFWPCCAGHHLCNSNSFVKHSETTVKQEFYLRFYLLSLLFLSFYFYFGMAGPALTLSFRSSLPWPVGPGPPKSPAKPGKLSCFTRDPGNRGQGITGPMEIPWAEPH